MEFLLTPNQIVQTHKCTQSYLWRLYTTALNEENLFVIPSIQKTPTNIMNEPLMYSLP
jgi:hypothetical protein